MVDPVSFSSRKRNRLKKYDYSKSGSYFITVCTNKREELFWRGDDEKGGLNDAGIMAKEWLVEMENAFDLWIDCWTIMPNHVHALIVLENNKTI